MRVFAMAVPRVICPVCPGCPGRKEGHTGQEKPKQNKSLG